MKELLVWLVPQVTPKTAATPPVLCNLNNSIMNSTSIIFGNIEGLQALGIWIVIGLLSILVVIAAIPKLRSAVISHALWVMGALVLGAVVVGALTIFVHPVC